MLKRLLMSIVLTLPLGLSLEARAQALPGFAVDAAIVNQSAVTLVELAGQVYPELFSPVGASTWRVLDGFHFRYFPISGVYVGVQGADLYLLGGPFGNALTHLGKTADILRSVQGGGSSSEYFQDYVTAKTLLDLIGYFSKVTMNYGSSFIIGGAPFAASDATIALEVLGPDTVAGAATTKLKVTISGTNAPNPMVYDMWVDAQGAVPKLAMSTFTYDTATSKVIGPGLVSAMLLAMVAADAPTVKAVINQQLANHQAVTQNTQDRVIGGVSVKTLAITVSAGASASTVELSDFGPFTMATKFNATTTSSTTYFEIVQAQLR